MFINKINKNKKQKTVLSLNIPTLTQLFKQLLQSFSHNNY